VCQVRSVVAEFLGRGWEEWGERVTGCRVEVGFKQDAHRVLYSAAKDMREEINALVTSISKILLILRGSELTRPQK